MRRSEYGTFHGYRPKYLLDYAQEFAWREDVRRTTEGEKVTDLLSNVFRNGLSNWWRGYWQGHHRDGELKVMV
jgi:ISXO2-like transposase domain